MGPLRPDAVAAVRAFLRCGDLAAGFTRFHCPDCGHEKLLAFTCKSRHFCPACHQRRVRQTGGWIAASVCHDVPHRQFVFTFPKMLRGIFRKRRHLLHLLFQTATESLRDAFRARLGLPDGRIAAAAAVHTFGDYLVFHPHLHVFAADGLFERLSKTHTLAVFTGRLRWEAKLTLDRFTTIHFDPIVGAGDVTRTKPDPEGLLKICSTVDYGKCWYIGDTIDDARAAHAAGVPFIGVGHGNLGEGAVAVLEDINSLEAAIAPHS